MRRTDAPSPIDERRTAIAERFEQAPGVLCCLDFDGTLAPIVEDPAEATIDPACWSVVADLATSESVTVAIVSGRALEDLHERVGLDTVVYAGNHGLELRRAERTEVLPAEAECEEVIGGLCESLEDRIGAVPGTHVEDKGVTATVHYRQVPDDVVPGVVETVEEEVDDADGDLEVLAGRQIREIRPDVPWDKGRVVASLAADVPADWEQLYVGDDTTDEDAFEVVEPDGLGVLVREREATAASVRLPSQDEVADFLGLVAERMDAG